MTQSVSEDFKHSLELAQSEPPDSASEGHSHLTNGEAEMWGECVVPAASHGHPRPTSLFRAEADLQVEDLDAEGTEPQDLLFID